jgi:hypothetical protein
MSRGAVASGNITPSTVLILDTSKTANQVLQASSATANPLYGIAQAGTRNAPFGVLNDGFAAIAGGTLNVFTAPDTCQVLTGAAFNAGVMLTTDSSGRAVAATAGQYCIGESIDASPGLGYLVEVKIMPQQL